MKIPYIKDNDLIIPFAADAKYKYWQRGQSIYDTLLEINAPSEIIALYCRDNTKYERNDPSREVQESWMNKA